MHLKRTKPDANLHRFYQLEMVPSLFDDWGPSAQLGRIGSSGQLRTDWFDSEAAAKDARFDPHMKKAKRGYE